MVVSIHYNDVDIHSALIEKSKFTIHQALIGDKKQDMELEQEAKSI